MRLASRVDRGGVGPTDRGGRGVLESDSDEVNQALPRRSQAKRQGTLRIPRGHSARDNSVVDPLKAASFQESRGTEEYKC